MVQWWLKVNLLFVFLNKFLNFNLFKDPTTCYVNVVGTGNSCQVSEREKGNINFFFFYFIEYYFIYNIFNIKILFYF